jgi:hypothetical protein
MSSSIQEKLEQVRRAAWPKALLYIKNTLPFVRAHETNVKNQRKNTPRKLGAFLKNKIPARQKGGRGGGIPNFFLNTPPNSRRKEKKKKHWLTWPLIILKQFRTGLNRCWSVFFFFPNNHRAGIFY